MVLLLPAIAKADDVRLGVVVREGPRDATIVERLRGQLADLDDIVLATEATPAIESTLEGQLAAAERIASARDARVVVWFTTRNGTLAVAIATPREHRLFVREIPASERSAMAEAAAIVVRGAVRSIALGGTIGVEVPARPAEPEAGDLSDEPRRAEPVAVPRAATTSTTTIDASLGWQIAIDGGAERGAHALVQRTTIARGGWGASIALALGVPQTWHAGSDVTLDVSRSGAMLGGERRLGGGVALGIGAGAAVYHRSTAMAPSGLTPTPSNSTVAFVTGVEVAWRTRIAGRLGFVAYAGVDVLLGAPEAVLSRDGTVETIDAIHPVQPRASALLEVSSW